MKTMTATRQHVLRLLLVVLASVAVCVASVACSGDGGGDGGDGDGVEPSGPVAAVQDDQLPVVPLAAISGRLDLIAETRATTTRVDLFWWQIAPERPARPRDPRDPAYDFARADAIIAGLAERGVTPIVSVYSSPPWAVDGVVAGDPVNPAAPQPADFADFMGAIATRYGGDLEGPEGSALPEVRHWELWNEPNFSRFLSRPDPGDPESVIDHYARMVAVAYPAIKRANPDAVVIAGVGGPRGSTGSGAVGAVDWMEGLAARDIPLDAYSQHIYPSAAPTVDSPAVPSWSTLGVILDGIEAFAPGLPLYITEAGYTTAETPFRDAGATVGLDEQAEYLRQIYDLPQVQSERVAAIVWFNLQDNVNWPAGLLLEDGRRKPSHEAFVDAVSESGGATIGSG